MASAAYKNEEGIVGVPTGLRDLDDRLGGLHKSDLIIIAGRPGMGKTALATNIAILVANAVFPIPGLPAIIIRSDLWRPPNLSSKSLKPVGTPTIPSSFL